MELIFSVINETVNKSAIKDFNNFLKPYSNVTKWYVCSDYCFDDPKKSNDVITFVIYPHDMDILQKQSYIQRLQKCDLKKTQIINPVFCLLMHLGCFFSFNFIPTKENYFSRWKNKNIQIQIVDKYIEMLEKWEKTTPQNAKLYTEYASRLRKFKSKMNKKSFNCKLMARILMVTFLAGYIKYLLIQSHQNVQLYSWLSDRDAITEWEDGVCEIFYHITSHCMCDKYITDKAIEKNMKEVYVTNKASEQFYDQINRIADYICGTLADYNYVDNIVSSEKQLKLIESAIADNEYIIIICLDSSDVKRINTYKV